MKAVHMDTWSIKEKLCLASAVAQEGEQDWAAVSRLLQPFLEPHRPADWFSERNCALQYNALLEKIEVPRRKKRSGPEKGEIRTDSTGELIKKKLTDERIEELKKLMHLDKDQYLKDKEEIILINCGYLDDQLPTIWADIQEERRQKEQEAKIHAQWLKDREERQKKLESEQEWRPPVQSLQRRRKIQRAGRRRNSSQSSPGSEPDSTTVDSPLPELPKLEVVREEQPDPQPKPKVLIPVTLTPVTSAPTPSSPLLTSLLKSPSPAPTSQASSILHSAITAQRGASPTIASLLSSSPGSVPPPPTTVSPSLKNLVSSAIATVSEEHVKPQNTSPSAGAPTLSMLLELPPSLPGKPLPELPSVARPPAPPPQQQPPPMPLTTTPQPLLPPPPPPLLQPTPPPQAHPSTTPVSISSGEEVSVKDVELAKGEENSEKMVEVTTCEDLKENVQCDILTDEAVLEMVLDTEASMCSEPATVSVTSNNAASGVKVHGSWVRALDFGGEVNEQLSAVNSENLKKNDNETPMVTTLEQAIPESVKNLGMEKNFKNFPDTTENDKRQESEEVVIEVVNPENEKEESGEVASEVEVTMKNVQDSSDSNYIVSASEQSRANVTEITQEDFNIQEVEVPMSETVAEVVEIAGDESQNSLLAAELNDISEQQVLEVIVGPAQSDTGHELSVELPERHCDVSDLTVSRTEETPEGEMSSEVEVGANKKNVQETNVSNVEAAPQAGIIKAKHELTVDSSQMKDDGKRNGVDEETEEIKKESSRQKTEEKSRSKKKKHSKGKKKKHSREKRNDSKNKSRETDSKADSKSSLKQESKLNSKPDPNPDPKSESKSASKSTSKSDPKLDTKSDLKPDPKSYPKSESKFDSKSDSKPSEKKEVQRKHDETKEKVKLDTKDVKKKDDITEKEVVKREGVKDDKKLVSNVKDDKKSFSSIRDDKKSVSRELSPERVKAQKEISKKAQESIQKDIDVKESKKSTENVSITDKKKKESDKEIRASQKETEPSKEKEVAPSSKESSKMEKGTGSEKQHRGIRKAQDVKNEDAANEEVPRKEKKEVTRRDSNNDTTHKKSEKTSDSEVCDPLKEPSILSQASLDEEDEKPLAEIVDEKKLQQSLNILTKEEKPARSVEAQSGEEDKTSDVEQSKIVSKKRAAATSTPVDSVPNSPAPSFTTDEEREHKAWKKAIMLLYNRLATHKYASLFLRPITNDLAPGYSSYIYKPVDLQMIKKNIENGLIRNTTEFQKEVMRMFKNAIMYNKSLHDVHLMALEMQEECLQHIEDFVATQMLVASVGETPSRRETRTMDATKQREFLRSPRPSSHEDSETAKPSKRKRNDTSSETPDHTPKRKTVED